VFVGLFEHSLDGKGRVVLPSTFRNDLAGRGVLAPWENCLGIWTQEGFAEVASRLTEKVREGLASPNAPRALSANAVVAEPDAQGRILVPQRLRDFAGLEREVVIIGALDRVEIWNAERWREISVGAEQSLRDAVSGLGI
jgi:MraZ protein